mmetsp:Transcript_32427/g.77483  ORF Transcript_32427/g.77483 Transcript_32427/m.77483 type:complete len:83 (-) Transcript_32427:227-475(-)
MTSRQSNLINVVVIDWKERRSLVDDVVHICALGLQHLGGELSDLTQRGRIDVTRTPPTTELECRSNDPSELPGDEIHHCRAF